jgi:sugar lactone lactonase YvrE
MDRLDEILEPQEPVRLATGFKFTEGPVWDPSGQWLFVDVAASKIYSLVPGQEPTVLRDNSKGSNGMTFDLQGRLLICESDTRRLVRRELDGTYIPLAERVDGRRLNRPNDVVTRTDGLIYFSDPGGLVPREEQELGYFGVHMVRQDGSVQVATKETEYPNGLAFSPDEKILYVAITRKDMSCVEEKRRGEVCKHQYIRAFDVDPDGSLLNGRVFANMHSADRGLPDGMKVDVTGRVYCTGPSGCWVFEPSGELLGIIQLPEIPGNCAWGGADHQTMLFAARTSVYTLRMKTRGIRIPRSP